MPEPWEIVHTVLDKFRGLPKKLGGMTDKSLEIYRSHGREPKTSDPIASGNVSPVTHYMRYVRLFEAAERGAGQMLSNRTHQALNAEFAENDLIECSQSDLGVAVLNENCDVQKWLLSFDIKNAKRSDLLDFERECDEAVEAIMTAKGTARAQRKKVELARNGASTAKA